nr:MinD/ParA family protein [Nocardia jejuensis]
MQPRYPAQTPGPVSPQTNSWSSPYGPRSTPPPAQNSPTPQAPAAENRWTAPPAQPPATHGALPPIPNAPRRPAPPNGPVPPQQAPQSGPFAPPQAPQSGPFAPQQAPPFAPQQGSQPPSFAPNAEFPSGSSAPQQNSQSGRFAPHQPPAAGPFAPPQSPTTPPVSTSGRPQPGAPVVPASASATTDPSATTDRSLGTASPAQQPNPTTGPSAAHPNPATEPFSSQSGSTPGPFAPRPESDSGSTAPQTDSKRPGPHSPQSMHGHFPAPGPSGEGTPTRSFDNPPHRPGPAVGAPGQVMGTGAQPLGSGPAQPLGAGRPLGGGTRQPIGGPGQVGGDGQVPGDRSGQPGSELSGQPNGDGPAQSGPNNSPMVDGGPEHQAGAEQAAWAQQAGWGNRAAPGHADQQGGNWANQAPQNYAGQQGGQGNWGPQGPQGGYPGGPAAPGNPMPSLDDVPLHRRASKPAGSGWRKAVHHISGGAINPGMSAEERRLQELVARIRQPVRGDYRIAVLSLKGGVGKTTTTMGLGSTFSSIRGDRVVAVDANPDFGTLSQRVPLQTRSTVRDLLLDSEIQRYSDVRRHTSQGSSRLEVLASERDPAMSEAFSEDEYRAVARILQRFYNIILTDCGTGLMHSAMAGVLDLAHSLVLISSSAIDGARSAAATLDWLSLHGHDHLVRNAVVVINLPRPGSPHVGINQLRDYFLSRCRAVHIIPYDEHLGEGAEIDLHGLNKATKRAYVELAATVADDFATDHRRHRG